MTSKMIFKSAEGFFEFISSVVLIIGLISEIFNFLNILCIALSIISFAILYTTKKFRRFVIYPVSLIYSRRTQYKIVPWNPESETRWSANLRQIRITTSASIKIDNLKVCHSSVIEHGKRKRNCEFKILTKLEPEIGKTSYYIVPKRRLPIDVNFFISFDLERVEDVDEPQPFLEYEIEYRPSRIPFHLWDSRRIR